MVLGTLLSLGCILMAAYPLSKEDCPCKKGIMMFFVIVTSGGEHTHTISESSIGGGSGHNHTFTGTASSISTLQPYITCYMWKRTA